MENQRILVDPVLEQRASPFSWIGPKRLYPSAVTAEELPDVDVVLITHDHYFSPKVEFSRQGASHS